MNRSRRIVLALLACAAGLEGFARSSGRTVVLDPEAAFLPDQRGDCGGALLETDRAGQRGGAADALARAGPRPVLVVGGALTAGAGLEDDERFPALLDEHVRAGGLGGVIALAVRGDRAARARELLDRHGDAVLILELDASDLGGDAAPTWIEDGRGPELDPVEPGPIAAATWIRLLLRRSERRAIEAEIADLCARDSLTGRAAARAKLQLDALTAAAQSGTFEPAQAAHLRALVAELHGWRRSRERAERASEWTRLFADARDSGRVVIVLLSGPTLMTVALIESAAAHGLELVRAPPFELDPQLRVRIPQPRPAAVVHARIADQLRAALTRRGLLTGAAAAPPEVLAVAEQIDQHARTRAGIDDALVRLVRQLLATEISIGDGPPPPQALFGVGDGGALQPDRPAEIVLARPSFPTDLLVRAEAIEGMRPEMRLRHPLDDATVVPTLVGRSPTRPGHEVLQWRFEPPIPRSPRDYPALELTLLPVGRGAPPFHTAPGPVDLRELRFVAPRVDHDGE